MCAPEYYPLKWLHEFISLIFLTLSGTAVAYFFGYDFSWSSLNKMEETTPK